MANNKSMIDQILETKRAMDEQNITGSLPELNLSPAEYTRLRRELSADKQEIVGDIQNCFGMPVNVRKPELKPPEPDQEEMDKLASKLTEAVLQLRAGDMEGARATLSDADCLCDVGISAYATQVSGDYLDAIRYGMGMSQHQYQTATEQLMRQQIAERQMRQLMEEMNKNVSSVIYPPHILSDNTADPTDSGV